jgi:hypothetical protein
MPLNMLIVPTYSQMLTTLAGWLDKAQAQLPAADAQALLSARLQGQALPPLVDMLLNEGRNAGEQPGSLQDARARIDDSIAMLAAVSADTPAMSGDEAIAHALPNGIILDLTAQQYARDWTLSQFYFHVMTAYAILRAQGVQLGKADYVAHMFGHIRPGTLPQG